MSEQHLATYLNDHLAGSVVALELLEHLEKAHAGTATARFAAQLRADIEADRDELADLMAELQVAVSHSRKAAAWVGEKASELKLRLDDRAGGQFHLFEALEALSLGIEGKRLLWRSLATVSEARPELREMDWARLEQRAEAQRRRVEAVRLEAVKWALGPPPEAT
jgi:hypothetical protein